MIEGYDADTPQSFWRRTMQHNIPNKWFAVLLGLVILQSIHILYLLSWWWVWKGLSMVVLALVEMAAFQWVSRADVHWDSVRSETWRRGSSAYYEAE